MLEESLICACTCSYAWHLHHLPDSIVLYDNPNIFLPIHAVTLSTVTWANACISLLVRDEFTSNKRAVIGGTSDNFMIEANRSNTLVNILLVQPQ